MCSLAFNDTTIRRDEFRGHHAQASKALGEDVTLNITVVVFACPDEATGRLDRLCDHVVNETVLVICADGFEIGLVCGVIDLLEDVLETTIVLLQDGVLGGHKQVHLLSESHLEG